MKMKKLLLLAFFVSVLLIISIASAGTVEHRYQGSNVCQNPTDTFITFEDGYGMDQTPITTQYPGVVFSANTPDEWIYGDVTTGMWNYPTYWVNGNVFATVEGGENTGRISFPIGASYVSILVSGITGVIMEAYDASDTLIDTAGPTSFNLGTQTMDRLVVNHDGIKYVLIHSPLNMKMDDVCTDAAVMVDCGFTPYMEFDSEPQGALIYFNDGFSGEITPHTFVDPDPGCYTIKLKYPGYYDSDTFSNAPTVCFPGTCSVSGHWTLVQKPYIATPEFPSIFLPVTMIIGFLGAVLLIQRTREN
jgi:hypothetical protein